MTGTEVRSMKDDEIKIELGKLRNKLYDMRTKRVSDTVEDTSQFGKAKKDIARLLTEQRSRVLKKAGK
ncbi:MAG: 50S ribosomal protein L29 [Phycisphaerales bacterium]